jgi:hypothetical protein
MLKNITKGGSRDCVVCVVTRLQTGCFGLKILAGVRDISLHQNDLVGSGTCPNSCFMGTRDSFHRATALWHEADHLPTSAVKV